MRWDNLLNCKKERTIFTRNQTKRYHGKRGKAIPKKGYGKRAPGKNRFWRLENMQETRIRKKKGTLTQKWSQGLGIFSSRKER